MLRFTLPPRSPQNLLAGSRVRPLLWGCRFETPRAVYTPCSAGRCRLHRAKLTQGSYFPAQRTPRGSEGDPMSPVMGTVLYPQLLPALRVPPHDTPIITLLVPPAHTHHMSLLHKPPQSPPASPHSPTLTFASGPCAAAGFCPIPFLNVFGVVAWVCLIPDLVGERMGRG